MRRILPDFAGDGDFIKNSRLYKAVKRQAAGIRGRIYSKGYEKDILSGCIMLKNLSVVYRSRPMSADFIIEELMKSSTFMRDVYGRILSGYRTGSCEEAVKVLQERVPTRTARNFAMILSKLDQINPAELAGYMEAFEKSMEEERTTEAMRRAETKNIIITAVATASVFAVLFNFVRVVIFIDAMEMLQSVF